MRITHFSKILLALGLIVTLGGCDYLYRQSEKMDACYESHGGTRKACSKLSDRYQGEAQREARREAAEFEKGNARFQQSQNHKAQAQWTAEIAKARAEDHAAITAKYSKWGWMSGMWCTDSLVRDWYRIEILGPTRLRKVIFHKFDQPGEQLFISVSEEIRHLRINGDIIEAWGGTTTSPPNLIKIRKGTKNKFIVIGTTFYKYKTTDMSIPFSGVKEKSHDYENGQEQYRCENGRRIAMAQTPKPSVVEKVAPQKTAMVPTPKPPVANMADWNWIEGDWCRLNPRGSLSPSRYTESSFKIAGANQLSERVSSASPGRDGKIFNVTVRRNDGFYELWSVIKGRFGDIRKSVRKYQKEPNGDIIMVSNQIYEFPKNKKVDEWFSLSGFTKKSEITGVEMHGGPGTRYQRCPKVP